MPRPKVLVFQHVPYEPLGTLDPLLKEAGFRIRYVNFGRDAAERPTLDKYAALIVLGGPMNADQIDKPVADLSFVEAGTVAKNPTWYVWMIPFIGAAGALLGGRGRDSSSS